jgi:hypothetical protein
MEHTYSILAGRVVERIDRITGNKYQRLIFCFDDGSEWVMCPLATNFDGGRARLEDVSGRFEEVRGLDLKEVSVTVSIDVENDKHPECENPGFTYATWTFFTFRTIEDCTLVFTWLGHSDGENRNLERVTFHQIKRADRIVMCQL